MKRGTLICLFLAALLLRQTALATDLTVIVDGQELPGEAFVQDGRTYVPLAQLLEAMGGWETSWDQDTRTAFAETELFSLTVPVQQEQVLADGFAFDAGAVSLMCFGRTYVPLRPVANLLGAQVEFVDWDTPVAVRTAGGEADYTEEDLYWLSRIISAESRGESLLGQLAVGNVVLNRVASSQFPNTIKEVVFDDKDAIQFVPVANGTVYDAPTEQSVLAARLVLNGTSVVDDCMFFFNPSLSQGLWIRQNCTYYSTIGCHQFYR